MVKSGSFSTKHILMHKTKTSSLVTVRSLILITFNTVKVQHVKLPRKFHFISIHLIYIMIKSQSTNFHHNKNIYQQHKTQISLRFITVISISAPESTFCRKLIQTHLSLQTFDQVTYCHTRRNGMRIDDDVWS
jgi:hypothetical protein